jgi:NodT family efflux transporter outer membrane factor (OMF) lipoprotein
MPNRHARGRRLTAYAAATALALAAAGCAVGPNFRVPAPPPATGYLRKPLPARTVAAPVAGGAAQRFVIARDIPGDWWTVFHSPQIDQLVTEALRDSPTLDAAQAALRQADEQLAAGRGAFAPAITGSMGATRARSSGAAFGSSRALLYTLNSASVNVSYTLDAFGGVRRQVEALRAQAEYQRFSMEGAYLALTANIVTAAIDEASLGAQIDATQRIAAAQRAALAIVRKRLARGGAARADVLQQQSLLATTLAALPGLEAARSQDRNLLAAYTGAPPAQFTSAPIDLKSLQLPRNLPVTLPSRLVEQRPDVRAYAALLHAATAEVGVATANLLPHVTLSGAYGGEGVHFSDIFSPASAIWSAAATIGQPIFEGGTLWHTRQAAVAAAQEAAANYKATVLTAFRNVADVLVALEADARSVAAEAVAARSASQSLRLVRLQYSTGAASLPQVLLAEQADQTARIALVKARAQRFADTAALYQALGGGWWHREDAKAGQNDCCKGSL